MQDKSKESAALDQKYTYGHTNIRKNERLYTFLCNVTNHTQEEIYMPPI